MPRETKRAADFVSDSRPRDIAAFWDEQLGRLARLNSELTPHQKTWDSFVDPAAKPDAGKVRTLTIRHLTDQCGMGGGRWIDQFPTGFPIAGAISRKGAYSPDAPKNTAIGPAALFLTASTRFRERARKAGHKNAPTVMGGGIGPSQEGMATPPIGPGGDGRPKGFHPGQYNVDFRFGVEQGA